MVRKCFALCVLLAGCGCVATQNVPVSTNPSGALVFLDGKQVCPSTPCSVDVPKDKDHLLTIIRPGYHQKDLPLRRVYDAAGTLRDSVVSGARAAKGGAGVEEVLAGTVDRADKRERDGSAYVLSPGMVALRLIPETEPLPPEPGVNAEAGAQGARRSKNGTDPIELGLEIFRILEGEGKAAPGN